MNTVIVESMVNMVSYEAMVNMLMVVMLTMVRMDRMRRIVFTPPGFMPHLYHCIFSRVANIILIILTILTKNGFKQASGRPGGWLTSKGAHLVASNG